MKRVLSRRLVSILTLLAASSALNCGDPLTEPSRLGSVLAGDWHNIGEGCPREAETCRNMTQDEKNDIDYDFLFYLDWDNWQCVQIYYTVMDYVDRDMVKIFTLEGGSMNTTGWSQPSYVSWNGGLWRRGWGLERFRTSAHEGAHRLNLNAEYWENECTIA